VADYLSSLGVRVEENVPGLDAAVPRSEVDIFLPDHNVAIEFDGVWWHAEGPSRERIGPARPSSKPDAIVARLGRLVAADIRLIRIFSDEWIHEREAIKSILRMAVGQEEQIPDLPDGDILLDRRLATAAHERVLAEGGYTACEVIPPICQYVHPSSSNTRVSFDSDEEAISAGFSRVWDSGYIVFRKK
jgi:hypothetical protein